MPARQGSWRFPASHGYAVALMQEKRIRRSSYGDARPARDFPMLARAYLEGRLMLDELITQRIRLDAINEAFYALREGKVIRSVIMFG